MREKNHRPSQPQLAMDLIGHGVLLGSSFARTTCLIDGITKAIVLSCDDVSLLCAPIDCRRIGVSHSRPGATGRCLFPTQQRQITVPSSSRRNGPTVSNTTIIFLVQLPANAEALMKKGCSQNSPLNQSPKGVNAATAGPAAAGREVYNQKLCRMTPVGRRQLPRRYSCVQ
jgi:hypothetical protein